MKRKIAIDFEFYNSKEPQLELICCVLYELDNIQRYWLYDTNDRVALVHYLTENKDDIILLAYAAQAEARSFIALGLNPMDFTWLDLYVEFRMLCNSNNDFNYGKYIDSKG